MRPQIEKAHLHKGSGEAQVARLAVRLSVSTSECQGADESEGKELPCRCNVGVVLFGELLICGAQKTSRSEEVDDY